MLISFIVPHYNLPENLLQRCITSIVAQNIPVEDYEILIVDDGSHKPPMWVEKEFCQTNIQLITAEHGGLGAARNIGLKKSSGKYIQFVDSDDCLIKDSVNLCLDIIRKESPDILQHGYRICATEEETLNTGDTIEKIKTYDQGADYVCSNNLKGSACTYIFKKELTNSHNIYFAEGVLHEDEDFTLKIYYYSHKLICCSSPIYNYCIRKGSITSNIDPTHEQKRIKDFFLLLKRVVTFRQQEQETCSAVQRKALNRKIAMLTVDTLLNLFYNGNSAKEIKKTSRNELYSLGLYPLPKENYSLKYIIFATLANNSIGLKLLRTILPSSKPRKR